MSDSTYEHEIEAAFVDLMDGNSRWYEIQENTGLSDERYKEIQELFDRALASYKKRNNLI